MTRTGRQVGSTLAVEKEPLLQVKVTAGGWHFRGGYVFNHQVHFSLSPGVEAEGLGKVPS